MIFNAAAKKKYAAEALQKLGFGYKLRKNDYAKVGLVEPLNKEDRLAATVLENLKGIDDKPIDEYMRELVVLVEKIQDRISKLPPVTSTDVSNSPERSISELDLINDIMPESRGKSGDDLKPYETKFDDAMYILYTARESEYKKVLGKRHKEYLAEWKSERGYLEGR